MFTIGWQEIIIAGAIILILFGARKISPEISRDLGAAANEYKSLKDELKNIFH